MMEQSEFALERARVRAHQGAGLRRGRDFAVATPSARWWCRGSPRSCGRCSCPPSMPISIFSSTAARAEDAQDFVNALTTNLTRFYREDHHFDHLVELCRRADRSGRGPSRRQAAAAHLVGGLLDRAGALHHRAGPAGGLSRAQALGFQDSGHRHRHQGARQGGDRHLSGERTQSGLSAGAGAAVRAAGDGTVRVPAGGARRWSRSSRST